MKLRDKTILCMGCGETILFKSAERIKYKKKRYRTPCYCKNCRYIAHQDKRRLNRRIQRFQIAREELLAITI